MFVLVMLMCSCWLWLSDINDLRGLPQHIYAKPMKTLTACNKGVCSSVKSIMSQYQMPFKCLLTALHVLKYHVVCGCMKESNSTKLLCFQNPMLEQIVFLIKFESNKLFWSIHSTLNESITNLRNLLFLCFLDGT